MSLILLSHTHLDHVGAVPALKRATGAPVAAFAVSALEDFAPDIRLHDGDTIAGFDALHTPGHAVRSLCFASRQARWHARFVQRRPCDVLVEQHRQPARRQHAGLFREPAAACSTATTICTCPATDRRCVSRATWCRRFCTSGRSVSGRSWKR